MTHNNRLSSILDEELKYYNESAKSTENNGELKLVKQSEFAGNEVDLYKGVDGEVYMTIDQLAKSLEYASKSAIENMLTRNDYLKDEEISSTHDVWVDEKLRNTRLFTEDGIYEITMLSKQPKAREFRMFVRELLKGLRTGELQIVQPSYQIEDSIARAERWIEEERERLQLVATVEEQRPKVEYHDDVLRSESTMPITVIAKEFGRSAQAMNVLLNEAGVQYKRGNTWIPYSQYQEAGYMRPITYNTNGQYAVTAYQWTEKGRKFIHELMRDVYGESPIYAL